MRRKDRSISENEAQQILIKGEYGVLSLAKGEVAYGIPLSYCYHERSIIFHSAIEGRKIVFLTENPRCSFCVVGETKTLPESFGTCYQSAIVEGTVFELFNKEKINGLMKLVEKYSSDFIDQGKEYILKKEKNTRVFIIKNIVMSGKARKF